MGGQTKPTSQRSPRTVIGARPREAAAAPPPQGQVRRLWYRCVILALIQVLLAVLERRRGREEVLLRQQVAVLKRLRLQKKGQEGGHRTPCRPAEAAWHQLQHKRFNRCPRDNYRNRTHQTLADDARRPKRARLRWQSCLPENLSDVSDRKRQAYSLATGGIMGLVEVEGLFGSGKEDGPDESSDNGVFGVATFSLPPACRFSICARRVAIDAPRARSPADGVDDLPSGTCSRDATCCACIVCPVVILRTTSGRMSAHICNALIDPHSMILLLSHWRDTGFVRKSLQPAARAATRSACKEDAVSATMITEERYGGVDMFRESVVEASEGVLWPSD